jgi:hypothetical protein
MVGPDTARKRDNHANLGGFLHVRVDEEGKRPRLRIAFVDDEGRTLHTVIRHGQVD